MIPLIKSQSNNLIKLIRSLKSKKNRQKSGLFIIEGVRFLEFVIDNNIPVVEVCFSNELYDTNGGEELLERAFKMGLKITEIESKIFNSITDTKNTQGIIALVEFKKLEFNKDDFKDKLILILDRIQDPGNLGTIIRTADAAGIDLVVLSKGTVDPYNEKVLRSTMGSIFSVPLLLEMELSSLIETLKQNDYSIVSSYLQTEDRYDKIDYSGSVAIVIGNEANGVSDEVIALSDKFAKIPIWGKAESLNASIAAGIIMYHASNSRKL